MKKYVDWQIASASGTIQMVKEEGQVRDAILRNAIETLDYNFRRSQEQIQHLLLERDILTAPDDPMDLDLPEPHLPDFIYQIQNAISKGQLTILPPVEEKGVRPRAESALTEEQFPVQICPPSTCPTVPGTYPSKPRRSNTSWFGTRRIIHPSPPS